MCKVTKTRPRLWHFTKILTTHSVFRTAIFIDGCLYKWLNLFSNLLKYYFLCLSVKSGIGIRGTEWENGGNGSGNVGKEGGNVGNAVKQCKNLGNRGGYARNQGSNAGNWGKSKGARMEMGHTTSLEEIITGNIFAYTSYVN